MAAFTLDISFDYPIQDSVSIGDTAFYVYTQGVGGFEINQADIVEIGEIISINRQQPYSITCSTDLFANQLEIGCRDAKDKDINVKNIVTSVDTNINTINESLKVITKLGFDYYGSEGDTLYFIKEIL